jgi:hypothetical protein
MENPTRLGDAPLTGDGPEVKKVVIIKPTHGTTPLIVFFDAANIIHLLDQCKDGA